jgi:alpha-L-arabinofuranosidase
VVDAQVLTGAATNSHNSSVTPNAVEPGDFSDYQPTAAGFSITLPARSHVRLTLGTDD